MVLINEKIPNNHFTYWAQYVKCTQNQFIILNIILSWIWKIFFLGKTHLYWFSDYLLFLLAELQRAKRASEAPWVRKFGKPPIRENLVMT